MRNSIKKLTALVTVLVLMLFLVSPVAAEGNLSIVQSSAVTAFPDTLTLKLSAQGSADITDIRLHYIVERESFANITSEIDVDISPGKKVDASWTLELLRLGGLPPGTVIDYWWTAGDANGGKVDSPKSQVRFEDKRYTWRSVSDSGITLYWYEGNDAFAEELMTAARSALARLAKETGATLEKPVRLYIYSSSQDLRGSMINPQEWTGGVAFTRYSIIAIGIPTSNLAWGVGAMAHELTHLVIAQVTANPYAGLPTWLDEGLAMYNEGPLGADYASFLNKAAAARALISVRSLASPFSARGNQAYLSYAESYSIVKFLIDKYGQPKMLELLKTFRKGATYDNALMKVYGFDMDGLNTEWQDYVVKEQKIETPYISYDVLVSGFSFGSPLAFRLNLLAEAFVLVPGAKRARARKRDYIGVNN